MEKIKWPANVTNEHVLEHIREKRTLLRRKANWIGHFLPRNCLLHGAIEGLMTEVKGVGRRTELLQDLRQRISYLELKQEAEDRN